MTDPPYCPICKKFRPCIHDRKEQAKNAYKGTVGFAKNAWYTIFGGGPSNSSAYGRHDDDFTGFHCAGAIITVVSLIFGGILLYMFSRPEADMPGAVWVYVYSWLVFQFGLNTSMAGFEKVLEKLFLDRLVDEIAMIIAGIILMGVGPAFIITIFVLNIVWEQGLPGSMWVYIAFHLLGCCGLPFVILWIIHWQEKANISRKYSQE